MEMTVDTASSELIVEEVESLLRVVEEGVLETVVEVLVVELSVVLESAVLVRTLDVAVVAAMEEEAKVGVTVAAARTRLALCAAPQTLPMPSRNFRWSEAEQPVAIHIVLSRSASLLRHMQVWQIAVSQLEAVYKEWNIHRPSSLAGRSSPYMFASSRLDP